MYLKLGRNEAGNDYVVGDIHGMYDSLLHALSSVNFNFDKDRLFVVGDLVDRGPQNLDVMNLIKQKWFYSVRGNHEQFAIDNYYQPTIDAVRSHTVHGGAWFYALDDTWQKIVVEHFQRLPLLMEVDVGGRSVGFVHANISDWSVARDEVQSLVESDVMNNYVAYEILWERTRIEDNITTHVDGIDHVFLGHTPRENIVRLGNTTFLDTGAVYGNKLTILNINEYLNQI